MEEFRWMILFSMLWSSCHLGNVNCVSFIEILAKYWKMILNSI